MLWKRSNLSTLNDHRAHQRVENTPCCARMVPESPSDLAPDRYSRFYLFVILGRSPIAVPEAAYTSVDVPCTYACY
jgi:hypothetical protein